VADTDTQGTAGSATTACRSGSSQTPVRRVQTSSPALLPTLTSGASRQRTGPSRVSGPAIQSQGGARCVYQTNAPQTLFPGADAAGDRS
jgi:hypothetical protein